MANTKISQLPVYTGSAADVRWFVMNNSGETTTFKFSGFTSPFILTGNSYSSIYSRTSTPTYIEDNTGNNLIWPGETLRLDDYCSGNTIFGTNHYLRTDNNAGDATTNCTIIGNENFVRRGVNVFIQGQGHTYDRGGITGGYMLGGASNVLNNCSGNASGIIGGQSNRAENYQFQNSTIIGGASNSVIGDVQNTSIFGSQSSQVGNTSYGAAVFGGASNVINGGGGAHIVGGYANNVNTTNCSGIYASRACNLTNSYEDIGASIWGSWNSTITAGSPLAQIFGGDGNTIAGTSPYSIIFGGSGNTISGITNAVMVGCSGRTATDNNTTYVESIKLFGTFKNDVYTGASSDLRWFLMTDSGQTKTYKFSGYTSPFIVDAGNSIFSTFGTPAVYDADCVGSVVIGSEAAAYDDYTTLIGWKAVGNNDIEGRCTAVGADAQATSRETAAFGMGTRASAYASTALGHSAAVGGERGMAIGNRTSNYGFRGITIGQDITASSPYGTLLNGVSNTLNSSGNYNNIFNGTGNSITGTTSGATMLSCSNRTATRNDATFVENLVVFNYAGLNFADDTAAAAGGVVLGQVYHTGGVLKIRIV